MASHGRKGCRAPLDADGIKERPRPRVDSALVGHWPARIGGSVECGSITELAAVEKIDRSYLCRVLRLPLLAREIVESTMDGRQREDMTLPGLMKGFPAEWEEQRASHA